MIDFVVAEFERFVGPRVRTPPDAADYFGARSSHYDSRYDRSTPTVTLSVRAW